MKMKNLLLMITVCLTSLIHAQDIQGNWNGKLDIQGQEMPLIFHFIKENNQYNGTIDIPTQGATGIPIEEINLKRNELSLLLMNGTIIYEGTIESDLIKGVFKQNGKEFILNLKKGDMKKPGNISLPSSNNELKDLAAKEIGNYKYEVKDYFAKPTSSSFKLSPNGKYMSFRKKDKKLKNHVYVKNIVSGEEKRIIIEAEELIRGYGWANDDRLIYVWIKGVMKIIIYLRLTLTEVIKRS